MRRVPFSVCAEIRKKNLVNPQGIRDPYAYTPPEIGSSAEAIRNFETDAERGAAADPDNAFFPAMQAASLLMQDRDDEAIAALHQAALRPLFRVYVNAEFQGAVRLIESRQKRAMPALLEETVAVAASMSMPDYGTVRTLSQVMVGLALEKEMCGDRKRGLAIRKDIARLGATMRATCDYAIGSEIGVAVTEVAAIDRLDPPFYDFSEDEEKAMMLRGYLASLSRRTSGLGSLLVRGGTGTGRRCCPNSSGCGLLGVRRFTRVLLRCHWLDSGRRSADDGISDARRWRRGFAFCAPPVVP